MKVRTANQPSPLPTAVCFLTSEIDPQIIGTIRKTFRKIGHYALVAALALLSFLLINRFVLSMVQVAGISMSPTLRESDFFLLNRWVYLWRSPAARDIVVIKDPTDQSLVVKRIVAGPGDFVSLNQGRVYVNGHRLKESYLPPNTQTYPARPRAEWMLGCDKDSYFVLGDNRGNSYDSRYYGAVPRQNILGLVSN